MSCSTEERSDEDAGPRNHRAPRHADHGCATLASDSAPSYRPATAEPGQPSEITSYGRWWSGWAGSRQPTLKWESFPRISDPAEDRDRISDVGRRSPDLASGLVRARTPSAGAVYAREGLSSTEHTLESALSAGNRDVRYVWSVRARFELAGRPRVTEWGGLKPHARRSIEPSPWRYEFFGEAPVVGHRTGRSAYGSSVAAACGTGDRRAGDDGQAAGAGGRMLGTLCSPAVGRAALSLARVFSESCSSASTCLATTR